MKKTLLSILGLTMVGSMSQACLDGGDLFQLQSRGGDVIANFNIKTGELVASSKSYKIITARPISINAKQTNLALGTSLCQGTKTCTSLKPVLGSDVVFMYRSFGVSSVPEYVVAQNLNLGPEAPTARGGIDLSPSTEAVPEPQTGEQDELRLTECSKRNLSN
jgi:hypothetical protein